jgi:hypothetical protein
MEKRRRLTPGELNLVNHSDKPALILEGAELVEKPMSGNDNHLVSVAIANFLLRTVSVKPLTGLSFPIL